MTKNLEQKKTWYTPVADIYHQARPSYSQELVDRAVILAQLNSQSEVLELGCGSGNATLAFAQSVVSITCCEINPEFCQLAQQNCQTYPQVKIHNTSFEEWELEANKFHAVLSANSFHWISPTIKYTKAAQAMLKDGYLILLWNLTPEPPKKIFKALEEVYQVYAPSLFRYEGAKIQSEILNDFRQEILDSGYFGDLVSEQIACQISYSIDQYLNLVKTLRRLEPQTTAVLFPKLKERLQSFGDRVELSFLSAVHIARKIC
ncbi:MAG: class I SAM-dependent methyltransferase [Cyanobacteria bacterium P01_A01_bin.40]